MCGIFGIFQHENINPDIAIEMSRSLRHRGPDDEGYLFIDGGKSLPLGGEDTPNEVFEEKISYSPIDRIDKFSSVDRHSHFLGHRRLSIQDISSLGHQPMSYRERYWVVYNGEIYNYIELREELEMLGHIFKSQSDTEVLLAAYSQWGVNCLNKFNGMWSFVLYDSETGAVFMARDRFGVKPFYYSVIKGMFIFASEPKAILTHPLVLATPNLAYLAEFAAHGPKEYLNETAFSEIFSLECSTYVHCNITELIEGNFERKKYWQLTPNNDVSKFDPKIARKLADRYLEILEDAVKIRLRADVKIGSALSGGLDSSSIVYMANKILRQKNLRKKQETFSCIYKMPGTENCDESIYIDALAKFLDVKSNQIEPLEVDVPFEYEKMIRAMDTPPENTLMSSWHTFKKVAESDVKVTLDGQGADEQLGGYLGYIHVYLAHLPLRDMISEAICFSSVPGANKHIFAGMAFNLLKKIGLEKYANILAKKFSGEALGESFNQRLCKDSMTLLGNLLHYADRTSMAYSIESRMPFMDYRLAEFLASIPSCYKIHKGWTKYLARLAFDGLLPDDVVWRRDKMGWPIPEKFWFSTGLKLWYQNVIKRSDLVSRVNKLEALDMNPCHAPNSLKALNIAAWGRAFLMER